MQKKLKPVLLFVLFNLILFFLLSGLTYVLRNKEYSGAQDLFKKWNPKHADIVFIGNSHSFCTISTDVLKEEYGVESFMLSTSAQTMAISYYAAMEAIELKHPDKIVFEMCYLSQSSKTMGAGMDHSFFDGMPICRAKYLAINDIYEGADRFYYWFPIGLYHSRWKEITLKDFGGFENLSERGTYLAEGVVYQDGYPLVSPEEEAEIPEETLDYFLKLIKLCKDTNTELILFVAPFGTLYDDENLSEILKGKQRTYNFACHLAEANDIKAYNLFYETDKMGIDPAADWLDRQHFNKTGQEKVTRYMMDSGYFGEFNR